MPTLPEALIYNAFAGAPLATPRTLPLPVGGLPCRVIQRPRHQKRA